MTKILFIYNPEFKKVTVMLSDGCQYKNVMNEDVTIDVTLDPYEAVVLYAKSNSGSDCMGMVTEFHNYESPVTENRDFFKLFPNPASDYTVIYISPLISNGRNRMVVMVNLSGIVLLSHNFEIMNGESRIPIDLSLCNNGIYFVILRNGEESQVEKLIVIK